MDQITASLFTEYEHGYGYIITEYMKACGCRWKVDQWGNVRAVKVCRACMTKTLEELCQVELF